MFLKRNGRQIRSERFAALYILLAVLELAGFLWLTSEGFEPLGRGIDSVLLLLLNAVGLGLLARVWLATGRLRRRLLAALCLAYGIMTCMAVTACVLDYALNPQKEVFSRVLQDALLYALGAFIFALWIPIGLLACGLLYWVVRPVSRQDGVADDAMNAIRAVQI